MINKWLPYVFVLIAIFLIFTIDKLQHLKSDQVKEASFTIPKAKITMNGQEVLYKSGSFAWVENGTGPIIDQDEPPILFHDLLPVSVKPFSTMKVTFQPKAKIDNIAVYRSRGDLEKGPLHFESIFDHTYTFNNVAGLSTVIIQATVEEQEYHYTFPIIIEEVVPYQGQLAEEKGYLAILQLYKPEAQQENWAMELVNNQYVNKAQSMQVNSLEEAQRLFPDFKIKALPYYAIFTHERLLYEANNREDFFKLLKIATP